MTTPNNQDYASRVHPANRDLIGIHPAEMLAQLGALRFDEVNPSQRTSFLRNFEKFGHVSGAEAAAKAAAGPSPGYQPGNRGVDQFVPVEKLPAQARNLFGAAKLDGHRRVLAADRARQELEALEAARKPIGTVTAQRLRDVIAAGWGGSVR